MRPYQVTIPSSLGCEVHGYLYGSDNPCDLGETMIEVVTPKGVLINAGWHPEEDPNGSYRITVTQGFKKLRPDIFTRDIVQAASEITKLAELFCGNPLKVAVSQTLTMPVIIEKLVDVDIGFGVAEELKPFSLCQCA